MACAIGVSFLSLALHHFFWLPWSIQEGMVASLFATVGYSISLEMLQLLLRLGTFQLSDIFYNTVGGVLGGLVYYVTMKARMVLNM